MAAGAPCGCMVEINTDRGSLNYPPRIVYCISHAHISERGTMRDCGCYCSPDLTGGGCVWEVEWCPLHAAASALLAAAKMGHASLCGCSSGSLELCGAPTIFAAIASATKEH